jgi:hypothetical protein
VANVKLLNCCVAVSIPIMNLVQFERNCIAERTVSVGCFRIALSSFCTFQCQSRR